MFHPRALTLSELPYLGEIAQAEDSGLVPSCVLNLWLEANTPSLKFNGHDELLEVALSDILKAASKSRHTCYDYLPPHISRQPGAEANRLSLGERRFAEIVLSGISLRLGPGSSDLDKNDPGYGRAQLVRNREASWYNQLVNPPMSQPLPMMGDDHGVLTNIDGGAPFKGLQLPHLQTPIPRQGSVRLHWGQALDRSVYAYVQVDRPKKRQHLRSLDKLFDAANHLDAAHINLRLRDLIWEFTRPTAPTATVEYLVDGKSIGIIGLINYVLKRHPIGSWEPAVTGMIVMMASNPMSATIAGWLDDFGYPTAGNLCKSKILKEIGTLLRRVGKSPDGQPVPYELVLIGSYWYCFHGRLLSPVNWEDEIEKRSTRTIRHYLPLFETSLLDKTKRRDENGFYANFDRVMKQAWRIIMRGKIGTKGIDEGLQDRIKWATGGSDSKTQRIVFDGKPIMHQTKNMTIQQYTKNDFRDWLKECPSEHAVFSDKPNEPGCTSGRAIGAPDMKHYCISSYATAGVESNLKSVNGLEKGLQGPSVAIATTLRSNILRQPGRSLTSMEDFVDFNSQHDPATEAQIYFSQWEVAKEMDKDDEFIRAVEWLARSHLNKSMTLPDGRHMGVLMGLFSGTKGTDIGNTMCNLGYAGSYNLYLLERIAPWLLARLKQRYGPGAEAKWFLKHSVRQGDDVFESGDKLHVFLKHELMHQAGMKFNPVKQDVGPVAEYLRKRSTADSHNAYPARGLGSLVVGDCLAMDIVDPKERAHAMLEHLNMLQRRGLPSAVILPLYGNMLRKRGIVRINRHDQKPLRPPRQLLERDSKSGGWSLSAPGFAPNNDGINGTVAPSLKLDLRGYTDDMKDYALKDWLTMVSEEIGPRSWDKPTIQQVMRDDIRVGMMGPLHRMRAMRKLKEGTARYLTANPGPTSCFTGLNFIPA